MALKDMLVHLDASAESAARLELAAALAARHGAHLVGLHASEARMPAGLTADAGGAALGLVMARLREEDAAEAAAARAGFEDRIRRDGLSGEWRVVRGRAVENLAMQARHADLTILGQPRPGREGARFAEDLLEGALFASGRPVLMVPYAGHFGAVGARVLIGWNATREAARAVADAMPFLTTAAEVVVLAINPSPGLEGHGEQPAADMAQHLARHGVKATAQQVLAHDVPEADVLLNCAADLGADLIVMGAYGHSRLRQMVFGGVTRGILARMTVPVLLSH